jgi:hypothetical protein
VRVTFVYKVLLSFFYSKHCSNGYFWSWKTRDDKVNLALVFFLHFLRWSFRNMTSKINVL